MPTGKRTSFEASVRWPLENGDGTTSLIWYDAEIEPNTKRQKTEDEAVRIAGKEGRKYKITFADGDVRTSRLRIHPYVVKASKKGKKDGNTTVPFSRFASLKRVERWPEPPRGTSRAKQKQQREWMYDIQNPDMINDVVREHGQDFDLINTSIACHRLAKFEETWEKSSSSWEPLLEKMREEELKRYSSQSLGNIVWALGKAQVNSAIDVVHLASLRTKELLAEENKDEPFGTFKPQELANFLLGAAKLDALDADLACDIASRCVAMQWKGFSPQEMTNVLWALTRSNLASPYVIENILKKVKKNITMFKPSELCNIAWCVAKAKLTSGELFLYDLMEYVLNRENNLTGFNSQDVSNLCWAMACMELEVRNEFLTMVAQQTVIVASQFSLVDIAGLVWALSKLCFFDKSLLQVLVARVSSLLEETVNSHKKSPPPQVLSNLAIGFAKLNFYNASMLHLVAQKTCDNFSSFSPQNAANTIWSCALLAAVHGDEVLLKKTEEMLQRMKEESSAEADDKDERQPTRLTFEQRSMLAVAYCCLYGNTKKCPKSWISAMLSQHNTGSLDDRSLFHKQVSDACESLGFKVRNEVVLEKLFQVDLLVEIDENRSVVVECDGPTHFLATRGVEARDSSRRNGNTLLKQKLLETRGHMFVSISDKEWRDLDSPSQLKLLQKKLSE